MICIFFFQLSVAHLWTEFQSCLKLCGIFSRNFYATHCHKEMTELFLDRKLPPSPPTLLGKTKKNHPNIRAHASLRERVEDCPPEEVLLPGLLPVSSTHPPLFLLLLPPPTDPRQHFCRGRSRVRWAGEPSLHPSNVLL